MDAPIFAIASYKTVMKRRLIGAENRGQLSRAAEALNCQRSYLSRVISNELQLSPDHALQLALFWKLKSDERDYFLTLVDHERAATPELRAFTHSKILDLRKKNASIEARTPRAAISVESDQVTYFSSWTWSAIHFLTSIPEFASAKKIADQLGLREHDVLDQLKKLAERGLIAEQKGKWVYSSGEFHVSKDSPLVNMHHQNWRSRALLDAQKRETEGLHYTNIQTMSRDDAERIKNLILDLISQTNEIAGPSTPEEAVVILCDFFRL